jgi:hypothetical protein
MDIRIINKKDEIINCSELSIKIMNNFLIGIDAEKNIVNIEEYGSEEEAREILRGIGSILDGNKMEKSRGIVIDLRKGKE